MAEENEREPREQRFPVTFMCAMLEVTSGGYYAWKKRAPSRVNIHVPRQLPAFG